MYITCNEQTHIFQNGLVKLTTFCFIKLYKKFKTVKKWLIYKCALCIILCQRFKTGTDVHLPAGQCPGCNSFFKPIDIWKTRDLPTFPILIEKGIISTTVIAVYILGLTIKWLTLINDNITIS